MKWFLVISMAIALPHLVLCRPSDGVEIEKARLIQFPDESFRYQTSEQSRETERILNEIHKVNLALGYVKKPDPPMRFLDSESYLYPKPSYHPLQSGYHSSQHSLPATIRKVKPDKANVSRKILHKHSIYIPHRMESSEYYSPARFVEVPLEELPRSFPNRNGLRKSKPHHPSKFMAVSSDVTSIVDYFDETQDEKRHFHSVENEEEYKTKLLDDVKSIIEEIERIKSKENPQAHKPLTAENLEKMSKLGNLKYVVFPATLHKLPHEFNRKNPVHPNATKKKHNNQYHQVNKGQNLLHSTHKKPNAGGSTRFPGTVQPDQGSSPVQHQHRNESHSLGQVNNKVVPDAQGLESENQLTTTGVASTISLQHETTQLVPETTTQIFDDSTRTTVENIETFDIGTEQNTEKDDNENNVKLTTFVPASVTPNPFYTYQFDVPLIPLPQQPFATHKFIQHPVVPIPIGQPSLQTPFIAQEPQYQVPHSQTKLIAPILGGSVEQQQHTINLQHVFPNSIPRSVLKNTAQPNYKVQESPKGSSQLSKDVRPDKQRTNTKVKQPIEAEKGPFGLFSRTTTPTAPIIRATTPKPQSPSASLSLRDESDEEIESYEDSLDSDSEKEKHIFSAHRQGIVDVEKEALKDGGIIIKRLKVRKGGIAIAGPGGVATAGSGGTAIVGPGGLAFTHPKSLTIAGPGARVVALPESYDLQKALLRDSSRMLPEEGRIVATGPTIFYNEGRK